MAEWYNSVFQNLLKTKKINTIQDSQTKKTSIAERGFRTIRNLIRKPIFLTGNAKWLSELPSVIKKFKNTIHHSIKMTPVQASKKVNEEEVYSKLQDRRETQKPNFIHGQLVKTTVIKRVFSKGDSTNYSYILYTIIEVIHDTIHSYRINYSPGRYNQNLILPTKLTIVENNQIMEKLNFFKNTIKNKWN